MRPLRTLHKGFDGFDVAFQGALNPDDIDILERARKQAEIQHQPALVDLGPGKVAMHVRNQVQKADMRSGVILVHLVKLGSSNAIFRVMDGT